MLFRPEAFEPLTDEGWSEARVRDGIARIAADVDDAFDPERMWPADEWDVWGLEAPLTGLYVGAAGVVWALDVLRRRGHAESRLGLNAIGHQALERWRARPDLVEDWGLPAAAGAGLLNGETGALAVAWRLSGRDELADDLLRRVAESRVSEADEVMWGTPGRFLPPARWSTGQARSAGRAPGVRRPKNFGTGATTTVFGLRTSTAGAIAASVRRTVWSAMSSPSFTGATCLLTTHGSA